MTTERPIAFRRNGLKKILNCFYFVNYYIVRVYEKKHMLLGL